MPWTCKQCGSETELGFNVCRECSAPRSGAEPPYAYEQYRRVERSFSDDPPVEQTVLIVRPAIQKLEAASNCIWWSVPAVFAFVFVFVVRSLFWGALVGLVLGLLTSYLLLVAIEWMICVVFLLESNGDHLTAVEDGDDAKE